jgi:PmbA protein
LAREGAIRLRALSASAKPSSSTDFSRATLDGSPAAAMRAVAEDPFCALADPARHAKNPPELDLADEGEPSGDELVALAIEAEDVARAVPGVTNSEGADAGFRRAEIALATSDGFFGRRPTRYSLSVSVLAGDVDMQRDYDYSR